MATKVAVLDTTTGVTAMMWEVDAEEAVRRAGTRYTTQATRPIPAKNPGGRGF